MIDSGLYVMLTTAPSLVALLVANQNVPPATERVFFSLAKKQAARPYIVLHILNAPPAETSLDGSSQLIGGEFQFDSYADDQLTARKVSRAVRDVLKDYSGPLSDGTIIQFTQIVMDFDDPYEEGGVGYMFRSVLRMKGFYTEGS
jgi:hypothetical protein